MITQIEIDEARANIRASHAIADKLTNIDWENRRYEIAKELLPKVWGVAFATTSSPSADISLIAIESTLRTTELLIEQLKIMAENDR